MDSARDTQQPVTLSFHQTSGPHWGTNTDHGGFAQSSLNLALAKRSRVLLPRASKLPTKRRNYWCKRCNSWKDWRQVRQAARMPLSRRFAAKGFPAVGAFIGVACATGFSDERSNCWVRAECLYCSGSCMHLWPSLVLTYQVSSYYMLLR